MGMYRCEHWLCGLAVVWALSSGCWAQESEYTEAQRLGIESHIGKLTGHAKAGAAPYKRLCIGCHGALGNGDGENAQWLDPRPRNFTVATFRCRSTPTGTLPTDEDLYDTVGRGLMNSNMPQWAPLSNQDRADLVAYIKHFSSKWITEKPGTPIEIPAEPEVTADRIKTGQAWFRKLECWKCHGVEGRGDGPSADTLTDDQNRPIKPFNFHDGTRFKCGSTDRDLYRIFMTGLDGTPMPSFADNVKPDEAWDLVFYLRTLQPIKSKEKQIAEQLGLKPINPLSASEGEAPVKAETPSAQPATEVSPSASSQRPQGQPAPTQSPAATPAAGAPQGTASPANPATAQSPEVQPAAEPTPGVPTSAGTAQAAGAANPVTVQPSEAQPAPESKPPAPAVTAVGNEATGSASPAANPTPVKPPSGLSRNSVVVHTAPQMRTVGTPRVELRDLVVSDEAGRLSVALMLSGAVVPQLKRLDSPPRVVVELPNTVSVTPRNRIVVGRDGAKAVRVGTDGQVPPTTRVVVDLTRPLAYEIVPGSDNSWILEAAEPQPGVPIEAGTAQDAGSANPVAIQPTETQPAPESKPPGPTVTVGGKEATDPASPAAIPTPVQPASGLSRSSGVVPTARQMRVVGKSRVELRDLVVSDEAGRLSVTLILSAAVAPQLKTLDSPARVVVDLPGTVSVMPQSRIAVGRGGAKAVRVGMDGQFPPTTRVVVDLTRPLAYEIVPGVGDNSWTLELHSLPENK